MSAGAFGREVRLGHPDKHHFSINSSFCQAFLTNMAKEIEQEKKAKLSELSSYIRDFCDYLEIEKNRSRRTRENYAFYLGRFATWAEKEGVTKVKDLELETV